jgi:hypothetical protein
MKDQKDKLQVTFDGIRNVAMAQHLMATLGAEEMVTA